MKGRNLIFMALLVLAAGVILIVAHRSIHSTGVVAVGGILFILGGLLNLLASGYERNRAARAGRPQRGPMSTAFNWVACVGTLILGVCMLIFEDTFVVLIPVMFGILVSFTALYQLYILAYGVRPAQLPGWMYAAPAVLVVLAIYLFMQKAILEDTTIMLFTGISLAFFGVATLVEGIMLGTINRQGRKLARVSADQSPAHSKSDEVRRDADSLKSLDDAQSDTGTK